MIKKNFQTYAMAAFAVFAIRSKAAGSAIAISLSILRLRLILAFLQPFISWLYLRPRARQAAVRRVIHNALKLLLRSFLPALAKTSDLTLASFASRYNLLDPRLPLMALRILFFGLRLAKPFFALGIFFSLKLHLFSR